MLERVVNISTRVRDENCETRVSVRPAVRSYRIYNCIIMSLIDDTVNRAQFASFINLPSTEEEQIKNCIGVTFMREPSDSNGHPEVAMRESVITIIASSLSLSLSPWHEN